MNNVIQAVAIPEMRCSHCSYTLVKGELHLEGTAPSGTYTCLNDSCPVYGQQVKVYYQSFFGSPPPLRASKSLPSLSDMPAESVTDRII